MVVQPPVYRMLVKDGWVDDQGVCAACVETALHRPGGSFRDTIIVRKSSSVLRCSIVIITVTSNHKVPDNTAAPMPLAFLERADHPFCRMSRSWSSQDRWRHMQATSLLPGLQLSSRSSEMGGASFTT